MLHLLDTAEIKIASKIASDEILDRSFCSTEFVIRSVREITPRLVKYHLLTHKGRITAQLRKLNHIKLDIKISRPSVHGLWYEKRNLICQN
jgi:hypothetical protein